MNNTWWYIFSSLILKFFTYHIFSPIKFIFFIIQINNDYNFFNRLIGPVVRVFTNDPGDPGSIPGHVIPKTLKMVLDTYLLNTQQYKVLSRVKWKNPGKRIAPSLTPQCSSYWKGSLLVALENVRQIYFYLHTHTHIVTHAHKYIKKHWNDIANTKTYCNFVIHYIPYVHKIRHYNNMYVIWY